MSTYTKEQISVSRLAYGNPYAHMEVLEESEFLAEPQKVEIAKPNYAEADLEHVYSSRRLLQNQYSHLDGEGGFDGLASSSDGEKYLESTNLKSTVSTQQTSMAGMVKKSETPKKYSDKEIEQIARNLQIKLWQSKDHLWEGNVPSDPIEILDPAQALRIGGYTLDYVEGFGPFLKDRNIVNIAGMLNPFSKKIHISAQFTPEQQLFTAAHELGHTLLHGESVGLHRDRPIDGSGFSRDHIEWAADKFAVYFLMPEKLVRNSFYERFRTKRFAISEETAFGLGFLNTDVFKKEVQSKRDFSRLLAGARHFHDNSFKSLAAQFRVSVGAMAIRIEELGLFDF